MTTPQRRVAELFAGVGGFRLGLEGYPAREIEGSGWNVVWSNQWEPATKKQHASDCYSRNWPDDPAHHSNEDIARVLDAVEAGEQRIPNHDLLVGGFPCQDYSVAKTLSHSTGLQGKKGVLWWQIERLLRLKLHEGYPPSFLMLENVDRLLSSPATQRGRDFAVMLASLNDLGYAVEWRVINAADYGFPQKRRRVFILGYRTSDQQAPWDTATNWVYHDGVAARAVPVVRDHGAASSKVREFSLSGGDLATVSAQFGVGEKVSPFRKAGVAWQRQVTTFDVVPVTEPKASLKSVLVSARAVPDEYWVTDASALKRWKGHKREKNETRTSKSGFTYQYKEGSLPFPDPTSEPARTILTGEGGPTPSRTKHIIQHPRTDRYRRLIPEELEALSGFPPGWTEGMPDGKRAFMIGNALVVGVVRRLGAALDEIANQL